MDTLTKNVDSFALFTRYMAEPLKVGNRPWLVLESIVNPADSVEKHMPDHNDAKEKIVLS